MSRTKKCHKYTRWDKEPTETRRWTWRRYRTRCRQLMREGQYELPRFRGTQGWEHW